MVSQHRGNQNTKKLGKKKNGKEEDPDPLCISPVIRSHKEVGEQVKYDDDEENSPEVWKLNVLMDQMINVKHFALKITQNW